jgi:4-diphosphocytidyl-2-C-methyl-D-erythritol kinase
MLTLKSFSKVNLGLWIKEQREDGFHDIETVFLENKNLYDEIEISFQEDKNTSVTSSFTEDNLNDLIPSEKNLTTKATNLFFNKTRTTGICNIKINKNIPAEAGLGGGSSNAATVLKGLNTLLRNPLNKTELLLLASELGSDVPFFIYGGTCLGKGRGEILETIENNLDLEVKIIKPEGISISTKWAYEQIDSREFIADHKKEIESIIQALKTGDKELLFKNTFNDFEMVVFSYYPELLKIRNELIKEGYKTVNLCGSGSAVYGIR